MNGSDSDRGDRPGGRRTKKWIVQWAPTVIWMLLIFAGSAWPETPALARQGNIDKVIHLFTYGVLVALLQRSLVLSRTNRDFRYCVWLAAVGTALYGLLVELYQIWVPGRNFQWTDLAANCVGIAIGLTVVLYLYTNHSKRDRIQSIDQNH